MFMFGGVSQTALIGGTLVAYRDRAPHGPPTDSIRIAAFNFNIARRPQIPTPTNLTARTIPQSPNMASQSVQCFGKKKTATGTTNPLPSKNHGHGIVANIVTSCRPLQGTQAMPTMETRNRTVYLQRFNRPARVLSRLTDSLSPSSSPRSCDSRSTSPS
jgi:hypothetical protein